MPLTSTPCRESTFDATTLLMRTRLITPGGGLFGPRARRPRRTKIGALTMSRIVMLVIATSSISAPSTLSIARPRLYSNTQFEIVTFLKPPLLSVPNLMRPVGPRLYFTVRLYVPSSSVPSS